jgi:hypothetical protein
MAYRCDFSQIFQEFVSVSGVDAQFKFKPFYAILEDGLDRMFEVAKSEEFHFV